MIRLLGSVLVAGSAAFWGHHAASRLREQVRTLEELEQGLGLLEQEFALSAPDLPRLMEGLSRRTRGAARRLFSDFARGLNGLEHTPVSVLWTRAVEDIPSLIPEGRLCLSPLGEILGRYDSREQGAAAAAVRARLSTLREEHDRLCRPRCRVIRTVGVTGGAFLVILLL